MVGQVVKPSRRTVLTAALVWKMLLVPSCAPEHRPAEALGHWEGVASFHGRSVPLELDFAARGDSVTGTMSSDPLLLAHVPLGHVRATPFGVHFSTADGQAPLSFEGVLHGDSLAGPLASDAFPQYPGAAPRLTLHRAARAATPIQMHGVRFAGAGVLLSGTLFEPAGPGPHPGLVLLQGSTLTTRDHYFYYADRFARAGFVVLAFDKRGAGASTGVLRTATFDDLIADAVAAVRMVATRPNVDSTRVGVWGLSQGAYLAPRVAALSRAKFVVGISAPIGTIGEAAAWQDSVRVRGAGLGAADGHAAAAASRRVERWAAGAEDSTALAADLQSFLGERWARHAAVPHGVPPEAERRSYYYAGRTLDSRPWWRTSRVPALVIYGRRDDLLPADWNADRVRPLLDARADGVSRVIVYPLANHDIKDARLDTEPFDWPHAPPGYIATVVDWMRARVFDQ